MPLCSLSALAKITVPPLGRGGLGKASAALCSGQAALADHPVGASEIVRATQRAVPQPAGEIGVSRRGREAIIPCAQDAVEQVVFARWCANAASTDRDC